MERPVLSHGLRTLFMVEGGTLMIMALLFQTKEIGLFIVTLGGIALCLGFFSISDQPYEPPFLKVRWHQFWISVRKKDAEFYEGEIADWKLEIEKRLSRIAELERDKQ